jgi:adenine-specific DNA methylase
LWQRGKERVYLPTNEMEAIALKANPTWGPTQELVGKSADQLPLYGMTKFEKVFTGRQLVA